MRIKQIKSQHRRDFTAEYECEHCGWLNVAGGYDDDHFHRNVIPEMECDECGKKAAPSYRPLAPKYAQEQTV